MGIYLILLGLLCGWIFFATSKIPQGGNSTVPAGAMVIYLIMGAVFLSVGGGLAVRKGWAKTTVLVLSVFTILLGIMMVGVMVFASTGRLFPPTVKIPDLRIFLWAGLVFGFLMILLPGFYVFFLTRPSVAGLFGAGKVSGKKGLPLGIQCIAWFYILSALSFICYLFFSPVHPKLNFGNYILPDAFADTYYLLTQVLCTGVAIGLLKRRHWGWRGFMILNALFVLYGLNNFFISADTYAQLVENTGNSRISPMKYSTYHIFLVGWLVFQSIVMIYVYKKRSHFSEKSETTVNN